MRLDLQSKKFDVLDDIPEYQVHLLGLICALSCCWGMVNSTILLVFASKIGFPLAITWSGISQSFTKFSRVTWFSLFLIVIGWLFFALTNYTIPDTVSATYRPSFLDFVLALGLGVMLSIFWHHALRTNIVVMSAGLASLLPACVMTGYGICIGSWDIWTNSIILYLEYGVGIVLGAILAERFYVKGTNSATTI